MTRSVLQMLPESKPIRLGYIGVGGCGTNVIARMIAELNPKKNPETSLFAINTDRQLLVAHFDHTSERNRKNAFLRAWLDEELADRFGLLQLGGGLGAGTNPDVARTFAEEKMEQIENILAPLTHVYVIGGLGKGTGTAVISLVAKKSVEMRKPTLAIVTLPLLDEGNETMDVAMRAREELLRICTTITIYNNNNIDNPNLHFEEAWKIIDDSCTIPMVGTLGMIAGTVGFQQNADPNDWAKTLEAGTYAFFGQAKSNDHNSIESVAAALVRGNKFQDPRIVRTARRILLCTFGKWSFLDRRKIGEAITEGMSQNILEKLRIIPGVCEEGIPEDGKFVAMLAVAAEGPGEKEREENPARVSQIVAPEAVPQNGGQRLDLEATAAIRVWDAGKTRSYEVQVPQSIADRWKRINVADHAEAEEILGLVKRHGRIGAKGEEKMIVFEIERPVPVVIGSLTGAKK